MRPEFPAAGGVNGFVSKPLPRAGGSPGMTTAPRGQPGGRSGAAMRDRRPGPTNLETVRTPRSGAPRGIGFQMALLQSAMIANTPAG